MEFAPTIFTSEHPTFVACKEEAFYNKPHLSKVSARMKVVCCERKDFPPRGRAISRMRWEFRQIAERVKVFSECGR